MCHLPDQIYNAVQKNNLITVGVLIWRMNSYVIKSLIVDVKESIQVACKCSGNNCGKIVAASGTAVLIPIAFVFQLSAIVIDQWAFEIKCDSHTVYNCTVHGFGCWLYDYKSTCLCAFEMLSCSTMFLLTITGCCVSCQTCYRSLTIETCSFCHVCVLSVLSLLPGTFSLCCCLITLKNNTELRLTLQYSWYVYATTGCATILISVVSMCGYTCKKMCRFRQDYDTQIGSDDDEREWSTLLKK
ncbi:uncharacterized protein LOC132727441 isoform X1 [Ruditapes philippinarum]|uniref:uncharacterized protein LOC132727441 isoform X1 n=1 Tax=Ruditapes philippinarum TaxID=129788 RepID=UPI00295C2836|nr:uncharacterized protein LOC132727441 isoform X1 [Ruditapes philippinarum]